MNRYIDPMALDRAAHNLGVTSDEQLAIKLKVSPQTLRNLRARRVSPSLETLVKIADAAGIPWERSTILAPANRDAA